MKTMCEDRETEAAAWGSSSHQIAERCLRSGDDAIKFFGSVEKSGKFEFVIDEEMVNCSQTYIDYCRKRVTDYKQKTGDNPSFWIEQKLSLDAIKPPLQAGGTADFIVHFPKWRLLEIVDLKGGRGVVVNVIGNPQGRSYGIGALLSLTLNNVDRVMVTIVQPRVGAGTPKSDEFHVSDLLDWTIDLLALMARSKQALDEFSVLNGNSVAFDSWAQKWLQTGQCTFCPALSICPKVRAEVLSRLPAIAAKWFEDPSLETPPTISNLPRTGSPEQLAHDLDGLEMLEEWISALRGHAHRQAENGVTIPGWQLADKIGNRCWIEKDETKVASVLREKIKLTDDQIYERSVRTMPQLEKTLKGEQKKELAALEKIAWHRPIRGTNLVAADKTTRPAAQSLTERFNESI